MTSLFEGLRAGDIKDLVLPLISIDEFKSKVSEDAVVVGFFVHEQMAADDLNRFLQRTWVDILDVDTAPAPDQKGYYMVFVEFLMDQKFTEKLVEIVKEISPLCGISDWKVRIRGQKGEQPMTIDILDAFCAEQKKASRTTKVEEAASALAKSDLAGLIVDGSHVILKTGAENLVFEFADYGPYEIVISNLGLQHSPVRMDLHESISMRRLQNAMGACWNVVSFGEIIVVQNHADDYCICLKKPLSSQR